MGADDEQLPRVDDPAGRLRLAVARIAELTRGRRKTGLSHQDADGDVGSILSDHAIAFDPIPVLRALSDEGARAVVIGQVAGILHGSVEPTGDLDLLWTGAPIDAQPLARAFASLRAHVTTDEGSPVQDLDAALRLPKVLFETATAAGDCCTVALPWGIDVAPFLERAQTATVEGATVAYLGAGDLVLMRRASGRPKDLRRADELERLQAK